MYFFKEIYFSIYYVYNWNYFKKKINSFFILTVFLLHNLLLNNRTELNLVNHKEKKTKQFFWYGEGEMERKVVYVGFFFFFFVYLNFRHLPVSVSCQKFFCWVIYNQHRLHNIVQSIIIRIKIFKYVFTCFMVEMYPFFSSSARSVSTALIQHPSGVNIMFK